MKIGEKIISRAFVPEDKTSWDVNWSEYKPISFSLDFKSKPWADPDIRLLITTTKNLFTFFIYLIDRLHHDVWVCVVLIVAQRQPHFGG